jgi:single-strand DNA-binding protein
MFKVFGSGTLGKDAEIKTFQSGAKIMQFSVASNKGVKNKQTGEWDNKTTWLNCKILDKRVDSDAFVAKLEKGARIAFTGELQIATWTDAKTQQEKSMPEVIIDDLDFMKNPKKEEVVSSVEEVPTPTGNGNLDDNIPW